MNQVPFLHFLDVFIVGNILDWRDEANVAGLVFDLAAEAAAIE